MPDLLPQICKERTNIEPRLVYADGLIERGDPRGAFITEQCELTKLDVLDERYAPALASTRRTIAKHAHSWVIGELLKRSKIKRTNYPRTELDPTLNAVFENGFLRRVAMEPMHIAKEWKWLAEREPIEGLELLVGEGLSEKERKALPEHKAFRILKLSPDGWFSAFSLAHLFGWGMPELVDIDLSRCDLGTSGCQLLANIKPDWSDDVEWKPPPPFPKDRITRLILHACQIGDEGARLLFAANTLTKLRELDISQCRIEERDTLDALRAMKNLEKLSIAGNNKLKGHLDALKGWDRLPKLVQLGLPQSTSAVEVKALFPSPSKKLRHLELASAKDLLKTPMRVAEIADALTYLDIGTTSVGDAGFAKLLAAPSMTRLLELYANGCSLSDAAVESLAKSKLRRLVTLDLSSNKLTDAALSTLADWEGLEHVTHLRIGNNRKVTSDGYAALVEGKRLNPARFDIGKTTNKQLIATLRKRFGDALVVTS